MHTVQEVVVMDLREHVQDRRDDRWEQALSFRDALVAELEAAYTQGYNDGYLQRHEDILEGRT